MKKIAYFDSRVFTICDINEVANYFVWRTKDAIKNSVQMYARSLYSHKQLEGKNISQLHDMIYDVGENWNYLKSGYKTGFLYTNEKELSLPISDLFEFYKNVIINLTKLEKLT